MESRKKPYPAITRINKYCSVLNALMPAWWVLNPHLRLKTPSHLIQGIGYGEVEVIPWNTSDVDLINSDLELHITP